MFYLDCGTMIFVDISFSVQSPTGIRGKRRTAPSVLYWPRIALPNTQVYMLNGSSKSFQTFFSSVQHTFRVDFYYKKIRIMSNALSIDISRKGAETQAGITAPSSNGRIRGARKFIFMSNHNLKNVKT